jgi:hypothetical protein
MKTKEIHLDVYKNKSILYYKEKISVFEEGNQNEETSKRYNILQSKLDHGYLEDLYGKIETFDASKIDHKSSELLDNLVSKLTSEVGRALIGLTFLQLTVKSIIPDQSVRLHKGGLRTVGFSWTNGISMRTIDSKYITPFLREHKLLSINKDGIMMTRSLAENYPYSQLYKADMRGPLKEWISIVDAIEDGTIKPSTALNYLISILKNKSDNIKKLADFVCEQAKNYTVNSFNDIEELLIKFYNSTRYSARAFEVVMHGFMQAIFTISCNDHKLKPLTQMRSANKKHGNTGDIEIAEGPVVIESWDAKFGKTYLLEELGELEEKTSKSSGITVAGFVVDANASAKPEISEKISEIHDSTGIDIYIFNFKDWISFQLKNYGIGKDKEILLANEWLIAVVESFAQKRRYIAPIDEPCHEWLNDLSTILKSQNATM